MTTTTHTPPTELETLISAATQAVKEAERLEAAGGPRQLRNAHDHREHARLWFLKAAEIAGPR